MAEKAKKVKKQENAIQRYFRETSGELRKVSWPTWPETVQTAIMVLIMTIILAVFFLGVDAFFNMVVKGLLSLAQ